MRLLLPLSLLLLVAPACSRSGLDGSCTPVVDLVTGDPQIAVAAVDAERVYWFREGSPLALRAGPRCQGAGGGAITLTEEAAFRPVAVAGDRVFFVDAAGTLRAVPRQGGPSEVIAERASPVALWSRPGELFWMTAGGFFVLPIGDSASVPQPLGPGDFARLGVPSDFRADGDALYWLAAADDHRGSALYRMARSDRSVAMLVPAGVGVGSPTSALALDGGELFFTAVGGQVLSVPVRGGTPRLLASYENPETLAVSAGALWWRNPAGSLHPGLRRVGHGGGAIATVAAPTASNPLDDVDGVWVDDGRDLHRLADSGD